MRLICIGSNSMGNCYILQGADETLILEAGVPMKEIKEALKFRIDPRRTSALVSHQHGDHAKSVSDLLQTNIEVWALGSVFDACNVGREGHLFKDKAHELKPARRYAIGGFKVECYPAIHDVECLSFVIEHEEMGRMLFATDTADFRYDVKGLNHILIEANYSVRVLDENMLNGKFSAYHCRRVMRTHCEFETTKQILGEQDLSNVREIVLIHTSNDNSERERYVRETMQMTGIPTYIARKGLEIDLAR